MTAQGLPAPDAMARFFEATAPELRKALKGTCIKATYRLTAEGGEVRLSVDLHSSLSFAEWRGVGDHSEQWAVEARSLAESMKEALADAARGESRYAKPEPEIQRVEQFRRAVQL